MSVPYVDSSVWVPAAVWVASVLGSPHCVSMCGGLVASTIKGRVSWASYHFGRLMGYLGLGALAGLLGSQILSDSRDSRVLSLMVAATMTAGLLIAGFRVWQGRAPHFSILPKAFLMRLFRGFERNALAMGVLTGFLPCGWLHAFVIGAIATQSPARGAGFLFLFWLGSLPALSATPWLIRKVFSPLAQRVPRTAAAILISMGILNIGVKVLPLFEAPVTQLQCHPAADVNRR